MRTCIWQQEGHVFSLNKKMLQPIFPFSSQHRQTKTEHSGRAADVYSQGRVKDHDAQKYSYN